jgi:RecB family exonuclease
VRIHSVERKETCSYEGLTLTGEIDRIDTYHDTLLILDYKSGKIPTTPKEIAKSSDFQLQFYTLLGEEIGEVADARYYDLGSGTLTPDKRFDDKMALLHEHFDMLRTEKEFNFTMTDALQKCTWCPYQKICNRIM